MTKLYAYVGPVEIRTRIGHSPGARILCLDDLLDWVRDSAQRPGPDRLVAATFVIDSTGGLWLADRRSEHVACAGGRPVLSAGELFLLIERDRVEVAEVSNQSTGYCPEPESWPTVAAALHHIGLAHPERFTTAVVFRRCEVCGERNIVKDGWFVCVICGADLPDEWNFA